MSFGGQFLVALDSGSNPCLIAPKEAPTELHLCDAWISRKAMARFVLLEFLPLRIRCFSGQRLWHWKLYTNRIF